MGQTTRHQVRRKNLGNWSSPFALLNYVLENSNKVVVDEELQMRSVSRKSLFLKKDILEGQIISNDDICLKRPGTGLYAKYRKVIAGSKAARNLAQGKMLEFGDFCE